MKSLRTPDDRFADLDSYPFAPNYVDGNLVTGQNHNAAPMVARETMTVLARQEAVEMTGQTV